MDKESRYLLQKIDCNCNNCSQMVRDFEKYNKSLALHHIWQLDDFTKRKNRLIIKAEEWKEKGEIEKYELLMREAKAMIFQFNKGEVAIHYGYCNHFTKPISFIPDICQLETQQCFIHRQDK